MVITQITFIEWKVKSFFSICKFLPENYFTLKQYDKTIHPLVFKPVEADAKHAILTKSSYKEVDVLGSPSKGCQWTLLQGDLTHPGQMSGAKGYI